MTGDPIPARPTAGERPVAVLTGFMGSGKSTVGRILADRLGVDLIDTDAELVRRTGRTIPDIFTEDGADGFRAIEQNVVIDVLAHHGGVVALGGGAVTTPQVRAALAGHPVVHLVVDAAHGYARVAGSDRPLLACDDPAARYGELLADRAALYAEVATIEVDAHADPESVAEAIRIALASEPMPERNR